ncbi:hypothetical protein KIPB_013836, partial [Kipferlia bialata]|eukprot:g13836.t1
MADRSLAVTENNWHVYELYRSRQYDACMAYIDAHIERVGRTYYPIYVR